MFKLCFYVPESHLEVVKNALFAAGAGQIGITSAAAGRCWDRASFAAAGSDPVSDAGELEIWLNTGWRWSVADYIEAAVAALEAAHPYEEPAWDVVAW